jgi:hypothetical protein
VVIIEKVKFFSLLSKVSGQLALLVLLGFFSNLAIGKYLHLSGKSIVAPINGGAEFLLFALVIILFTICALTKEVMKIKD